MKPICLFYLFTVHKYLVLIYVLNTRVFVLFRVNRICFPPYLLHNILQKKSLSGIEFIYVINRVFIKRTTSIIRLYFSLETSESSILFVFM
jgi:hypothetical protein